MDELDPLQAWTRDLAEALGLDLEVDRDLVLDLAGVAARAVVRPAAPVTTFLVGYAAARDGSPDAVARYAEVARRLAESRAAGTSGTDA